MNRYDVFNRGQGFFIYLFHLAVFDVHPRDRDDMKMYLWPQLKLCFQLFHCFLFL